MNSTFSPRLTEKHLPMILTEYLDRKHYFSNVLFYERHKPRGLRASVIHWSTTLLSTQAQYLLEHTYFLVLWTDLGFMLEDRII